jgi:hypothetical protein
MNWRLQEIGADRFGVRFSPCGQFLQAYCAAMEAQQ